MDESKQSAGPAFDPFTITAPGLQALLEKGTLTSTEITDVYLQQIAKNNGYLRAVLNIIAPELLKARISELDAERASGRIRGPLHGIPVLIKDNLVTSAKLGMPTTSGGVALAQAESSFNAAVVDQLLEAGAIILGKTNLSELSFWKGGGLPCGWSAIGGQSQSAYVRGGVRPDDTFGGHSNPGGSSSGSAIAVSAGFAPISIGTETDGSLVMPSNRAALYSLKPTHGFSSVDGIVPVSLRLDTVGPLAKSPEEVGIVLDILAGNTSKYSTAAENKSWSDIRVGVLDPEIWKQPPGMIKPDAGASAQMLADMKAAYAKVRPLVKTFHENVDFIPVTELAVDGTTRLMKACYYDFANDFNGYLSKLEKSPVRTLADLIKYNEEHSAEALPEGYSTQDMLSKSLEPGISKEEDAENWRLLRETGRERGIDATLAKYNIDVILAPADSPATKFPSAAGYPDITLPLSYLDFNGRPFGVVALASAGQEELLLRVAGAWQATFPARSPPPLLVGDKKGAQDSLL